MTEATRRFEFKSISSARFAMKELRAGVEIDRKIMGKDAAFRIMGQLIEEGFRETEIPGRNNYCFERL